MYLMKTRIEILPVNLFVRQTLIPTCGRARINAHQLQTPQGLEKSTRQLQHFSRYTVV